LDVLYLKASSSIRAKARLPQSSISALKDGVMQGKARSSIRAKDNKRVIGLQR